MRTISNRPTDVKVSGVVTKKNLDVKVWKMLGLRSPVFDLKLGNSKYRSPVLVGFIFIVLDLAIILWPPSVSLAFAADTFQSGDSNRGVTNSLLQVEVSPVDPIPKLWEIRTQNGFQNRGLAQIEHLGKEYVLTVYCDGIHRVFIHHTPNMNLEKYVGKFLQIRYTYGDVRKQVQCIQAPCGSITQRKILIQDLEEIIGDEETRAKFEAQCSQ